MAFFTGCSSLTQHRTPGDARSTSDLSSPSVENGDPDQISLQNFCSACHSLDDVPLTGPNLRGIAGSKRRVRNKPDGELREIEADAAYLRQSILDPNALLVDGYPENLMPPIGAIFTEAQVDALVDYLLNASQAE